MNLKTYKAPTLQEALALVRRDLGAQAAVLHTREVRSGRLLGWLLGSRHIEVTASTSVHVPSRIRARTDDAGLDLATAPPLAAAASPPAAHHVHAPSASSPLADEVKGQLSELQSMVEDLCRRARSGRQELPQSLFHLYAGLIDADVSEELARELVEEVRAASPGAELDDEMLVRARLARLIEDTIAVTGPIALSSGRRRLAALVGPTGVGKTTTIAKLAANFRLREKKRVGLITVDTYRIAAVEQLRTYADIMDLPMEVVSTPREMREAAARMQSLDLVLLDTAGRSPADEVKIQELKAFLGEAACDDVLLVLSAVSSAGTLQKTVDRFAAAGTTGMILTKLDEAAGLGTLLPLLRSAKLPLTYVTDGQNVPDDIAAADRRQLARLVLGMAHA